MIILIKILAVFLKRARYYRCTDEAPMPMGFADKLRSDLCDSPLKITISVIVRDFKQQRSALSVSAMTPFSWIDQLECCTETYFMYSVIISLSLFPCYLSCTIERSRFYRLRNVTGEVLLESVILIDPGAVLRV